MSIEKQKAIIGKLFLNPYEVKVLLKYNPFIFSDEKCRLIIQTIIERVKESKGIDLISMTDCLKDKMQASFLSDMLDYGFGFNIDNYLNDLEDDYKLYQVIKLSEKIRQKKILWNDAKTELKKEIIEDHKVNNRISFLNDNLYKFLESIQGDGFPVMQSKISFIDEKLDGWEKTGRMIVIAGRPGTGKTSLLSNINLRLLKQDYSIGFFSAEMSTNDVIRNTIANLASINTMKLKNKKNLTALELNKVVECSESIYEKKYYIDDTPNIDVFELEPKIETMINKYKVDVIGIDYLQLLSCSLYKRLPNLERLECISKEVKRLTRVFNIPFFCLAQLNRDADNGRPTMNNLKGCGQIEQDADMIILLWAKNNIDNTHNWNYEIIIEKNKYGATGSFPMIFQRDINRFIDYKI